MWYKYLDDIFHILTSLDAIQILTSARVVQAGVRRRVLTHVAPTCVSVASATTLPQTSAPV